MFSIARFKAKSVPTNKLASALTKLQADKSCKFLGGRRTMSSESATFDLTGSFEVSLKNILVLLIGTWCN